MEGLTLRRLAVILLEPKGPRGPSVPELGATPHVGRHRIGNIAKDDVDLGERDVARIE